MQKKYLKSEQRFFEVNGLIFILALNRKYKEFSQNIKSNLDYYQSKKYRA